MLHLEGLTLPFGNMIISNFFILFSSGFPLPTTQQQQQQQQERMGNCVSSQSQAGAMEKQAASTRGRGLVAMRKVGIITFFCNLKLQDYDRVNT